MTKKAEKNKQAEEKKKKAPAPVKVKEKKRQKETAETMAARQRDISVSEFFAKNSISSALTIQAKSPVNSY